MEDSRRPPVLLIGDTLNLGGTEKQFVELACGLDRTRWDLHVTCLRAEGPLRSRLEVSAIAAWSCGTGSLRPPRSLFAVWTLVRYLRRHRINLVHCFDFYSNVLGVISARLAAVPVVIASQRNLGDLRPPLERAVNTLMLRLASHVVVNSEAVADRLRQKDVVDPRRLVVISNGVDLERFSSPVEVHHRATRTIFGTLANLRPEKGLHDLVHAAAIVRQRHPETRLVVWGEGPLRAQLELLIRDLRLSEAVHLPGHAAQAEVALRGFDVFVLPSLSESCSNALIEAMAYGLPVIASNVGGNRELVQHEATGLLVPPGDPARLAEAMLRLTRDPVFAAQLAARGRDRVRSEFGVPRMVRGMQALYESALASTAFRASRRRQDGVAA